MSKELEPLYYAIIRHFEDGRDDCARGVVEALSADYGDYKLLTVPDVEEALATAKENGLLEECRFELDEARALLVYYRMTDFGRDMLVRYLNS